MSPIKLIKPLDPIRITILREIQKASQTLGFEAFMIGAMARIILLEHVHGLNAGRVSNDMDFAIAIANWERYAAIKTYLIQSARFVQSSEQTHRLIFNSNTQQHGFEIDLIPFGEIETAENAIHWPPEMTIIMNVTGYEDALQSALQVELAPDLVISICALPSIAILKIFAWADRRHDTKKDAADLVNLLRSYVEAGNQERVYETAGASDVLEAVGYDTELTGAWLLGKDASLIASHDTKQAILNIIQGQNHQYLVQDMARALTAQVNAIDYSGILLKQFLDGLQN